MTPSRVLTSLWLSALLSISCSNPNHLGNAEDNLIIQTTQPTSFQAAPEVSLTSQEALEVLTGATTRVAWIRDLGDGTDILGFGNQVVVMGFDSSDTFGERLLVAEPGSYAKPLITPTGDRVVYMDRSNNSIHIVSWNGAPPTRLMEGFPLAVWSDPNTKLEWLYVGKDPRGTDPESYGSIYRHPLDKPQQFELVWNKRAVNGDNFQLSRDGRLAGALARWPAAGILELPNGDWRQLGEGCWTSLASDDSHLFWYFDGQHRNLTIVDTKAKEDRRWTVNINTAPGIDGFEVYHPRWTNHPRFFAMTGSYTVGNANNKIRGGGNNVEIHLGRFSADYRSVESWTQVTTNNAADFYPDVWIAPNALIPESTDVRNFPTETTALNPEPLTVDVRVNTDVLTPEPEDIAPYRNGLLILEYEVIDIIEGHYNESTLLAAHWIIRDALAIEGSERQINTIMRLSLEPYAAHPELEGERVIMDSDRYDLPIFYDVDSASGCVDP